MSRNWVLTTNLIRVYNKRMKRISRISPPPRSTDNDVLTTEEIAVALRISLRQAQVLCDEGEFPHAYRTSSGARAQWRIPRSDLDAFKAKTRRDPRDKG